MEIFGIGNDIVEIERIKNACEKREGFLKRYFTQGEIELFEERGLKYQTVAGSFCAKEALSKALGTGVRGFSLRDIEVLRDELGAPYINVYGELAKIFVERNIADVKVSISHSREHATSVVILQIR